MFETSGKYDEALLKEAWRPMFGRTNKVRVILVLMLTILYAILLVYWEAQDYLWIVGVMLVFDCILTWLLVIRQRKIALDRMQETNGIRETSIRTSFSKEGVHIYNEHSGGTLTFPYTSIKWLHETEHYILLQTPKEQTAVVFKDQGIDRDEFLAFLKTMPTAIQWQG